MKFIIVRAWPIWGPTCFWHKRASFYLPHQSGKVHFDYIYGVAVLGVLSLFLILNLMSEGGVDGYRIASVLGYCLLPMVMLSGLSIIFGLAWVDFFIFIIIITRVGGIDEEERERRTGKSSCVEEELKVDSDFGFNARADETCCASSDWHNQLLFSATKQTNPLLSAIQRPYRLYPLRTFHLLVHLCLLGHVCHCAWHDRATLSGRVPCGAVLRMFCAHDSILKDREWQRV